MYKALASFFVAFFMNVASANPLLQMMAAEDHRRTCASSDEQSLVQIVKQDFDAILSANGIAPDRVSLLVGRCEGFASAATTLGMVIVSPELANLPASERRYLLAHEIGHIVNNDLARWKALGELIFSSGDPKSTASIEMPKLSQELELGADRWAAAALSRMGVNAATAATAYFRRAGLLRLPGTASHPSARERVAAMSDVVVASAI